MDTLRRILPDGPGDSDAPLSCGCTAGFDGQTLEIDAVDCPEGGRLAQSPDCRETAVRALARRDAETVVVHTQGLERVYETDAAALLVAAGRFVATASVHDQRLADRVARDPLAGGREATGRADATADVAAETGLAELVARTDDYDEALAPLVGLALSDWRVDTRVPDNAEVTAVRTLDTGGTVRVYDVPSGRERYVLNPVERHLDADAIGLLAEAYERLATGQVDGGERAPGRAVKEAVADRSDFGSESGDSVDRLRRVLDKHTQGYGLLTDLFADECVSDVFLTAPVEENLVRVRVGDRTLPTNIRLSADGARALASRFRRESGRGFSRAAPTLDAGTDVGGRRVRVAGVTEPASDGLAFAFRAQGREVWTLPALVANGTLTADCGALLSVAVQRGAAVLIAGARGTGKTTLLGALLPELGAGKRVVAIEDTPELPVGQLQAQGRDVQPVRAGGGDAELSPTAALHTALRLGNGALVVGEVRGSEAQALYEAMRVGANSEAVLGTLHGDGVDAVHERVVEDLGVPASSFGVTDLVVTLERTTDGTRRVASVEEVVDGEEGSFAPLFDRESGPLAPTGRLDRGKALLLESLRQPEETYAEMRTLVADRTDALSEMAQQGRTDLDAAIAATTGHD